ncbi:MAG: fasciclin domain-containing protein [Candidatus Promineifilaceae bacterium]|jgi:transforming growth factor-beta-induced protein
MKWVTKSFLLLIVLLFILAPAAFAQEAAPAIPANSITGIAVADGRFDTLAAAAVAAGLADDLAGGEWTVFAPTDDAFAKLGLNADNVAGQFSADELADLLLYHTLQGKKATADLKAMLGNVTMANGQQAGLKFYEDQFYVNDDSKVIIENVLADNGYIHVVDTVILPPWPREEAAEEVVMAEEPAAAPMAAPEVVPEAAAPVEAAPAAAPAIPPNSIAGIAIADGRFDTLVAAVVAAGLADDLAGGDWTVFAPTDDAFAKLELTPDNIASAFSQEELVDILLYHVLVGSNSTAELKGMLGNVVMANGKQAGLKFYEDHIYVNDDSKVVVENIIADNGTIHAVDTVILPPWPRE